MNTNDKTLHHAPLGKETIYPSHYQPELLFPVPRKEKRGEIGIGINLPFQGKDLWNGFELSWLNAKGKPVVCTAEFIIPCESPNIIESKSFKLYLNSFNNTSFDSPAAVHSLMTRDLSNAAGAPVTVKLIALSEVNEKIIPQFEGTSLDSLDIRCDTYTTDPSFLKTHLHTVSETLHTDLLKSNCPITNQPDWGSVQITYTGKAIDHEGLLKYIVSFRNHDEFHEQCVERIFMDILKHCEPEKLFVFARYTRRGGLDINPYRANYPVEIKNQRLARQ